MIYWKIQLTPKTPYFFGNERSQAYQDNRTQKGLLNPYYIPSNEMPAQSALFGVLRYLGIHHPTPAVRSDSGRQSTHWRAKF